MYVHCTFNTVVLHNITRHVVIEINSIPTYHLHEDYKEYSGMCNASHLLSHCNRIFMVLFTNKFYYFSDIVRKERKMTIGYQTPMKMMTCLSTMNIFFNNRLFV